MAEFQCIVRILTYDDTVNRAMQFDIFAERFERGGLVVLSPSLHLCTHGPIYLNLPVGWEMIRRLDPSYILWKAPAKTSQPAPSWLLEVGERRYLPNWEQYQEMRPW